MYVYFFYPAISPLILSMLQLSQKRLPDRANRGLDINSRKTKKRALEITLQQLTNRYWLLYFEDNSVHTIWSRHGSVVLDMMKRSEVTDGSFVDVRYNFKNPRTNSFIWTGTVLTVGHKSYCDREAASARIQVTEADGNVSFVPVVQRPDPDLTIYEDVNQILLQEDQEAQSARKKIKFVASSQRSSDPTSQTDGSQDAVLNTTGPYMSLHPAEVSNYLDQIATEDQEVPPEKESNENSPATSQQNKPNSKVASDSSFDIPKCSSTPANKKIKRTKTINPDDITEMEVRRSDLEASLAIKEAADKIVHAAEMIVNCMQELKPEIRSLTNRNYKEIQMSTNAVKQLVSYY